MEDNELTEWSDLIGKAIANAMSSLSKMIGQEIEVSSFGLRRTAVTQMAQLMGGAERVSVSVYVAVSGAADGHMMLINDPEMACGFVDMMMMQPPGTTSNLGELERSALGELGNVVGTSFLNVLADSVGISLHPSPPTVLTDMTGALLDIVAADTQLRKDYALVAETSFRAEDRSIHGKFFVVPSDGLLTALRGNRSAA